MELVVYSEWNCLDSQSGTAWIVRVELLGYLEWNCFHIQSGTALIFRVELVLYLVKMSTFGSACVLWTRAKLHENFVQFVADCVN